VRDAPVDAVHREVLKELFKVHGRDVFGNVHPAYDGVASFYMPKRLSSQTLTEKVSLPDRREEFQIKITESAVVNMASLVEFLKGGNVDNPQSCVHCLDVIMRSVPTFS
jgi:hypothetical protein